MGKGKEYMKNVKLRCGLSWPEVLPVVVVGRPGLLVPWNLMKKLALPLLLPFGYESYSGLFQIFCHVLGLENHLNDQILGCCCFGQNFCRRLENVLFLNSLDRFGLLLGKSDHQTDES